MVREIVAEGDRVVVEGATSDRERFNGKTGRVREVRQRRHLKARPFVFVVLDGGGNWRGTGARVFWPEELRKVEKGA